MLARFHPITALKKLNAWLGADDRFYGKLVCSSLVGIFSIAMLAGILLSVAIREHRFGSMRNHALDVVRLAEKVENDLSALETGHRGFLLTGQTAYLDPFQENKLTILSRLDELKTEIAGDPAQFERATQVHQKIDEWLFKYALPEIKARREQAPAVAGAKTSPFNADALGKSLLDSTRELLKKIETEQQASLDEQKDQQSESISFEILVYLPKLEGVVADMNKAEWGYLLTGDKSCFDSYNAAFSQFYGYYGHLYVLLENRPKQLARLIRLREALEQWQNQATKPEILAREQGQEVLPLILRDHGKQMMDDLRTQMNVFEKSELDVYKRANMEAEISRFLKTAGFSALCILAIGFLVASSWYSFAACRRHLRKVESAEAETRSIIATTLDGVITMNDQGLLQSMNPAAEKMFGYKSSEVVGRSVSKLIPQRLFLHDMSTIGRGTVMAVGQRQNYYPFPIEISLSEMTIGSNRHFVAIIRDVTERKRSEETLKHIGLGVSASTGEEFVRSLVKQLSKALQSDFAFVVEAIKRGDDNVCSMVIAEHGHIRRKSNYKLNNTVYEEVLKKGFRAYPDGVRGQFPDDEILNELNADSFVAMPLVDHKGRAVGLMGVIDRKPMENIQIAEATLQIFAARAAAEIERKRFEEDLAAEKERLAVTLRSIADGFITTDVEGKILLLNNVAEKLTGWTQEQAVGKPLGEVFKILNDRTRKPCQNAVERIIETGSVVGMASHAVVVSTDGTERQIESSAAPIRDKTNRKIGVVLVFRDVTDKNRAEEERGKAEKLESLGVAAGGIAHDFNNLLTAIIGNLSLALITIEPEEEVTERLIAAKKASLRAQELAQQLLTFAKGGAPLKKTASIGQLVKDTVSFSLRGSNIKSAVEAPESLWPVEIDAGQISQVLSNLTINAEQAMPAGGTIRVTCENFTVTGEDASLTSLRSGKYVKIVVRDEGIGIPEEYLKKIFDPYFTTKPKGSGLGLATSYSIIKNHDGLITVDSRPGNGSVFYIYLPASEKEVPFERARSHEPIVGKGNILVLDDEEAICALVTHALSPIGFTVTESNDANTAIRLYSKAMEDGKRYDAVIMDLTIPGGMGGAEAVKKLLEIDPSVRAIVSSGYAMDPIMSRYQEYGFCGVIAKPYEISDLCHVVHEVITSNNENMIYHDFVQTQLA